MPCLQQGQRIRSTGTLCRRSFPGGLPMELTVHADGDRAVLSPPSRISPPVWGQRLRRAAARSLTRELEEHEEQLAVYQALLLGYRKNIPAAVNRQFRRTGTLHIFAISGLHVGMVGLIITVILKTVGIPRDRWGLWLLPLLLGYALVTGMKTSALRAVTMAAVYFLAPLFRRQPDVPAAIAFAAILLLFCKPTEILAGGFIFSFTVVSFIVMFFSSVPAGLLSGGHGWTGRIRTYLGSLMITSVAAFLASAPLTALFFGSVSPVALAGNLMVVPLTFCIVLTGWLSILFPPAAGLFNPAALLFINGLLGSTRLLARLPWAQLSVPAPPPAAVLFWYAGWISLFTCVRTHRQRTAAWFLITWAVVLTFLTLRV
jgi:ComEC/Rec2-related protein